MANDADRLAQKCLETLSHTPPSKRIIIGIAGVPGSGKTTLGAAVSSRINEIHSQIKSTSADPDIPLAISLPMDGFHYSRAHLSQMPNSSEAIHRRGAAFTFDAPGFCSLISALVSNTESPVLAPSFDHAAKDPVADSIKVFPGSRIVLVEGNYCALNREPWKEAAGMMSEIWYVDTPSEVAWKRLSKRHFMSGIVDSEEEAWKRATGTDELNAKDIRENLLEVDEIIKTT